MNAEEIQTTKVDGQTDAEHAKLEEGLKEGGTEENASKPETQAGDGDEAGQERKEASIEDEVDDSAEKAEPEEEDARQSETEVGKEDDREESVSDNSVEQEEKGDGDTEAPIETENLAENLQIVLNKDHLRLQVGQVEQLHVEIVSDITEDSLVWTSDCEDIVTVEDGLVIAVGAGTAVVTVEMPEYGWSQQCTVEVIKVDDEKTKFILNYDELTMQELTTEYLEAELEGEPVDSDKIVWKSSNEDIVYIEDGEVVAFSTGEAVITAKMKEGEFEANCTIKVVPQKKRLAARGRSVYNAAMALNYAKQHWNVDGYTILCAEFVSNCINAGGISSNIWSKSATALRKLLNQSGFGEEFECSLSSDGYVYKSNCPSVFSPGDVVFYYCAKCDDGKPYSIHVVLNNGFDASGRMKAYSHNSPNDGARGYRYNTKCYDCKGQLTTVHIFHFNGNAGGIVNNTPQGYLDSITTSNGSVTIAGWAKDNDDTNRAVEIRMEVGGSTYTTTANLYRGDVGSHGFNATFKVNCSGTQTANVYAVDAETNQPVLLKNGSRTITIQRVMNLEYSTSKVEIPYQSSTRVSFTFQGDGIYRFDWGTGDGRIAQATLGNIDWTNGTGYVNISSGQYVGNTNLTIYFLDSNGNRMYQKSVPITIKGNYNIQFDSRFYNIRVREEDKIQFTVTGTGFSTMSYTCKDTSIAASVGEIEKGSDGKYSIAVHGFKEGDIQFYIELRDINNEIAYKDYCVLRIRPRLNIRTENSQVKTSKNSNTSMSFTFQGYGVSDVSVVCDSTGIADVSLKDKDITNGSATLVVSGKSFGNTEASIQLLDYKGAVLFNKSVEIIVQEAFDVRFKDSNPHYWVGETNKLYLTYDNNYTGIYGIQYDIEEGQDVVQIVSDGATNDGDENGRWISLKGLQSGAALLTVSFNGLQGDKEIILYEESITILVLDMKVSPAKKTSYVGETIQLSPYCDPATPTNLNFTYKSSDNTVASVSNTGLVTVKKKGNADITVSASNGSGTHSAVCKIEVIEKTVNVTGVTVSPTSMEMQAGESLALEAQVLPANATNNKVTYTSSNTAVATVDEFGRVKAVEAGSTRITVTTNEGGKMAYCNITVTPAVVASGKTGDLDWKITGEEGDYTLTISGQGEMADYASPESENDSEWYTYHDELKHLVLGEGITKIGTYAFACCDSFEGQIRLPKSLNTIGFMAFAYCLGFSGTLELPEGLTNIEAGAFRNCSGISGGLVIPDGTNEIEARVFYRCSGLDGSLIIPESVKTIGDSAFLECSFSGSIKLPKGLTSIKSYAFAGCKQLEGSLELPESLNEIGGFVFQGCSGLSGDITIPEGVARISQSMFSNCTGLGGRLVLPANITEIEINAFSNTRFSDEVLIPSTVEKIRDNAFKGVPTLRVYFEGNAPSYIRDKDHQYASFASDVQIYYNPEKEGWSTPEWHGYAAEPISTENPKHIPIEGIDLGKKKLYMLLGDTERLQYKLRPENTTEKDIVWVSSDSTVVTVDENGWVTAVGAGEVQVTVSTKNGKYTESCNVLVEEQAGQSMYADFADANSWVWVEKTNKIDFQYGGCGFEQVNVVSYDTSIVDVRLGEQNMTLAGESVQRIDNAQSWIEIEGVSPGKALIAVQLTDSTGNVLYSKTTEITVVDLELSDYYREIKLGENYDRLQASTYPDMEMTLDVSYSSSDEATAMVSDTGIIYAVKQGTAIITVTSADGLISKGCDIVVYEEGKDEEYEPLSAPIANIESGSTVEKGTEIILSYVGEEADIYYTTDGSVPTKASILYTKPIKILEDTTIRAFAVKEGFHDSDEVIFTYTVRKDGEIDCDWGDILPEDWRVLGEIPAGIWIAGVQDKSYTSKAILQSFRVYDGNRLLKEKTDYTVSYKNNTKAYTLKDMGNPSAEDRKKAPQIVIKTKGNYAGSQIVYFNIIGRDISDETEFDTTDLITQYNKKKNTPMPTLTWNGKKLKSGTDFYVKEYEAEKSNKGAFVGTEKGNTTYELTLAGKGNFTGERKIALTVIGTWTSDSLGSSGRPQILMNKIKVSKIPNQPYTGKAYTWEQLKLNIGGESAFKVTYRNKVLEANVDYEILDIINSDKVGTAILCLRGLNTVAGQTGYSFVGIKEIPFKVTGSGINKARIYGLEKSYAYTGTEICPSVGLEGIDAANYTVEYQNNKAVGRATVTVKGINACTGTKKATFRITGYPMDGADIKVNEGSEAKLTAVYTKGGAKLDLTVSYGNRKLTEGKDYTLKYSNNKKIADAFAERAPMVTIRGKGDFSGSRTLRYSITMADITQGVTMRANDLPENKKANKYQTKITLYDTDGKTLKAGTDYDQKSVGYYVVENNAERMLTAQDRPLAGTVITVKVKGKGNYGTGEISATYRILPTNRDIAKAVFKIEKQPYTGRPITLTQQSQFMLDKNGNVQAYIKLGRQYTYLTLGKDFEVVENSYVKNVNKGKATVTLHGIGEYGGYKTVSFNIGTRSVSEWWKGLFG